MATMICAHCGRPAASLVWIGSHGYHEECTRGPGHQPPSYWHPYHPGLTEADVRRIVREELARSGAVVKPTID